MVFSLGAGDRGTDLLEHGKSMVQHLCLCKDREGPDDHFVDGRHIGDRNDHIDVFVRLCVGS